MRMMSVCSYCGSKDIEYIGHDICHCNECKTDRPTKEIYIGTPYERTRNAVYATGNKWAIENFNATH